MKKMLFFITIMTSLFNNGAHQPEKKEEIENSKVGSTGERRSVWDEAFDKWLLDFNPESELYIIRNGRYVWLLPRRFSSYAAREIICSKHLWQSEDEDHDWKSSLGGMAFWEHASFIQKLRELNNEDKKLILQLLDTKNAAASDESNSAALQAINVQIDEILRRNEITGYAETSDIAIREALNQH